MKKLRGNIGANTVNIDILGDIKGNAYYKHLRDQAAVQILSAKISESGFTETADICAEQAVTYANALIEKLKESD